MTAATTVSMRARLRRVVDVETPSVHQTPAGDGDPSLARLGTPGDIPALLELYGPERLRLQRWRRRRRLQRRFERGHTCYVADGARRAAPPVVIR